MTPRQLPAAWFGITLAIVTALFVFDPAVTPWFPSCPWYALTGWSCPFCGSLRALHALLHGQFDAALRLNPLTTIGALAAVTAGAHDLLRPSRPALTHRLLSLCFSLPAIALAAAFGVLRNLR
jgi:hypothetical protein